ncbi:MAG: GNAT family N-acetyltransferase [Actinomycetes bacterium]
MEPVELSDDRLVLRLPTPDDVDAITDACQDEELQRWIPVPVPYEREHAVDFVNSRPERWAADDGEMTFAVTDAADGRLLGMVGLHARDATMREIGFWTAPWARGTGVMTDAARLVCRFGFEVLGLARIEWWAGVGNDASWRVAEKLGFLREGTCRARLLHRGERLDGWVAGLLPGDLT